MLSSPESPDIHIPARVSSINSPSAAADTSSSNTTSHTASGAAFPMNSSSTTPHDHIYGGLSQAASPAAMTKEAIAYREEQLKIAAQAAEMNPELTGSRPAHQITIAEKSRLMSRLIPLLFLDGRVYFATVGAISAVRERDRSVVLTHKINLAHSMNSGNSGSSSNAVMATPTSILSLPPNLSFSDFVAKWAPNFAVLYGEPQILNNGSGHAGKSSCATTGMGANAGVGNLRFCKVAVNPDAVVGIYPEDGWCTVVEVTGPSFDSSLPTKSSGLSSLFSRNSSSSSSSLSSSSSSTDFSSSSSHPNGGNLLNLPLNSQTLPTTQLRMATALGDALRKLRPESFMDIVAIVGNRDVGYEVLKKMSGAKENTVAAVVVDEPAPTVVVDEAALLAADIKVCLGHVSKGEVSRGLRATAAARKRLTTTTAEDGALTLAKIIKNYDSASPYLEYLPKDSDSSMAIDSTTSTSTPTPTPTPSPEIHLYLGYLVLLYLHDTAAYTKAAALSTSLVAKFQAANKRSLDPLGARIYFYHARFLELGDKWLAVRPLLLAAHRTATLRNDVETQASILNILLRNYLHLNHYAAADKLVSKTQFPEQEANNSQLARYMYYMGRIRAIQLDYTASHTFLTQALRKVLHTPATAGFQQSVQKVSIIVQLLMGEIPERTVFNQPMLKKSLAPYLSITSAVRVGDLHAFQETLAANAAIFQRDKTYTLILRLRHNVIKTGIRMISLSYSRISLKDVCLKLQLDSEEDAEYIVAKAIRDGVVDAIIDHEKGYMKSKENVDIYSTNEPQAAFDQRISFCLNLHNESVQAMRYPMNAHKKEIEKANELLEEDRKLASEIAEGGDDDDEEMGEF